MNKTQWKQGWSALRALGYFRTAECYGLEIAEAASVCFLKREQGPNAEFAEFPFAPLGWRLKSFKVERYNSKPLQG